jgi:predicted tellurium resistance membrane protein TerC
MHWVTDVQLWLALLTLTAMEIVLGIDNIIFISILTGRLPHHSQGRARVIGLALAMITRIALLLSITWIMRLTHPFFTLIGHEFSGRDLILVIGGLFLLAKSVHEIHEKIEGPPEHLPRRRGANSFAGVIVQIAVLDIVFSIDSVITAVGMTNRVPVMITAIVIAVAVMMLASGGISRFVDRHPTIKILALSFLLLIGVTLVADGLGQHISKGYIYFAMAFAFFVEMLNLRMRKKEVPEVQAG